MARLKLLFVTLSLFLALNTYGSSEYVVLTNPEGREIVAKILSYHRDYVTIELKDTGREIRTEITLFSEESKKKIEAWAVNNAVVESLEFGVSSKRFSSDQHYTDSTTSRRTKEGYTFRATNKSRYTITGITAKYCIVVRYERMGRRKSSDHSLGYRTGSIDFPDIAPGEVVRVESMEIELVEEKLNPGWSLGSGGETDAEDELVGVIVEYYHNDKLLLSDSTPNTLSKNYSANGPLKN